MTASTAFRSLAAHPATCRAALVLLAIALYVLATGLVDGGAGVAPARLLLQPLYPLANALPGLLAALLLLVLSRRLVLSFALAFLLQSLVYGVNRLKVDELATPLMPADFRMAGQLTKGGAHLLFGYLPHSPWPWLGLAAGVAAIIALWRFEPALLPRRTSGKRLTAGLACLLALATLLAGTTPWGRLYDGNRLWLEPWSASSTSAHSGLISSLLLYKIQYAHSNRKADPAAAAALIDRDAPALRQRLAQPEDSRSELPDIVVIQSESFFDPAAIKGYETSDFTPNLKRLEAEGDSGPLHVPTYGGGTIRSEFEMLTGLSLRYFDNLQFPYLQMDSTKVVPSLVRVLRAHGYATVAIHGNSPAFWNRTAAFKALGFDRFVSQAQFPADAPMDGKYMADSAMTDEIIRQLKDSGPPQFLFAISIEAHGPYDVPPRDTAARDAIPVPLTVPAADCVQVQNYLYHIGHADQQLGRLAQLLKHRSRPTLLLFYGDHLPALTEAYRAAGFVDGRDMLLEPGTWLLVDPRHPGQPMRQDLAAWMLPGLLLDRAGIHDDPYFELTQIVAPLLAPLTHAPGAPPLPAEALLKSTDDAMGSVALLRMKGKLDRLLPSAPRTMIADSSSMPPTVPPKPPASSGVQQ